VLGQIAASAALDDLEYLYSYVDEVSEAKGVLASWLREKGFEVQVSEANFVMVQVPHPAAFIQLCEEESVFIRDRSKQTQLERYVRISVGTVEQTRELCERLGRVLSRIPQLA
jgi:histidinol-phosphate aminotransferase